MANIGLEYLVCAKTVEANDTVTFTNGMEMANAIKADLSIEINEAKLFSNNRMSENLKEFKSGKLTLNIDHLSNETLAFIAGHTIDATTGKLTAKAGDDGEFVGVGFFADSIKDGVKRQRAIWLHKVKFGIPNESLETKGESFVFQTPTIEGTILADITGVWKEEMTFTTPEDAKDWLKQQAGIV